MAWSSLPLRWNNHKTDCNSFSWQLAAQVLDDLDDEDIGFGLLDEKKDSAVAKKLGTLPL